jgi:hypothetical protein
MPQEYAFWSLWKTGPTSAYLRSHCFEIQYMGITS